ncbi:4-hydroxybenzoate octaprenyltransferase [Paradesertivirga mongoliensis]|uniref:4-hydroxybenzoate octaprenyltransferase n=1 Tax=Paradesertivirga mongoliensis TaxID=2100740 RepID=A0ABW4ZS86_9SPHI|nr:4-hydroxybenzoate octaprenyltransferase [Pedobacter mongoliensis]
MKKYLSLVLFAHTIFAMPFAFIGFFLALSTTDNTFSWMKLIFMIACMVFARNAAMAFNRFLDRNFDAENPRTKQRDIPAGRIPAKNALIFTAINCVLFIFTTYFINPLCFYLSPVALAVVLGYSFTKRFTPLCHLILGIGLGLAPIGAYLVVAGEFAILPIFFSLAVVCWVSGFDIIYSLQDDEFDRNANLYSIPAALGRKNALRTSSLLHVFSVIFVSMPLLYGNAGLGWLYVIGVVFFIGLLIYQHRLVKPDDLSRVNLAFGTTNGIASVIFATFFLLDVYFR